MIYEELKNYLVQITDAAVVEVFDNAVKVFDQMYVEDYLDVYENAIGDYSDEGDTGVLDAMTNRTYEMIDSLLLQHGVVLNSSAVLSERIAVMQALCHVNEYEDSSAVLLVLEGDGSAQEVLANVIGLVSSLNIDNLLSWIDSVDDALITRLNELFIQPVLEQLVDTEVINARQQEYGKYKIVFSESLHWADTFIRHTESIGLPFDSYAKLYMANQLKADIQADEAASMKQIAINLIGIGCVSKEGTRGVQQNARPYLEQIYPEMAQLTRLDMKLASLLLEFNRAQT